MTKAIPASYTVQVNPGVLSAGGNALELLGVALTANTRVPIGSALTLPNAAAVLDYFGGGSAEYAFALNYFAGYTNRTAVPAGLTFWQYNQSPVAAYLRGGSVAALGLAGVQALSGVLTITIDGQTFTSSTINLSAATSFSNAASLIQTALGAVDASVTGAIAPATASLTGSIAGNVLTVTAIASGVPIPGAVLTGGAIPANVTILSQLTGPAGGTGTYQVSQPVNQTSTTITATSAQGILTVSAVASGVLANGQVLSGSGVTAGTAITGLLTGAGSTGTYIVSPSQTASSTAITAGAAQVTYDSTSGAFVITGGTPGAAGTIGFATGSIAAGLELASTSGAVLSQGQALLSPAQTMAALVAQTTNFATFTTLGFKPSIANMVALAAWNATQEDEFAYVMWDTDGSVTTNADSSSAGSQIIAAGYGGTIPIYEPSNLLTAAGLMGSIASIDFNRTNGRRNLKFLNFPAITPGVTTETVAAQLTANGYNYYGANANANNEWNFFAEGSITGPFLWGDDYINQIWLNAAIQTAVMTLLTSVGSVPYNPQGNALIYAACLDPINAALNFGAINTDTPLNALQITEVNEQSGLNIGGVLSTRGWYLQIQVATATVRAARASPPITLWYTSAGSVNRVNIASIVVQ